MPELGYPQDDFIKAVKRDVGKLPRGSAWLAPGALIGLHDRKLKEMLGSGEESIVVPDPSGTRDTIAVAFAYRDKEMAPERAKGIFYLQRIFSTLFPHNFPHFYFAAGRPERPRREKDAAAPTGTIRQRIRGLRHGQQGYFADIAGSPYVNPADLAGKEMRVAIHYPFEQVRQICSKEFGIEFRYDRSTCNFILGSDGGEYYVDTIEPAAYTHAFSGKAIDAVVSYMRKNEYDEKDIAAVRKSIDRFRQLWEEKEHS